MYSIPMKLLHQQFEEHAQLHLNKTAVVDVNQSELTYKKLLSTTENLAAILQSFGMRENTVGIIYMEKCVQYVVAYISILRAGGAYLPLDVSYPAPLIKDVIQESEPIVIFTKSYLRENIASFIDEKATKIICLDDNIYQAEIKTLAGSNSILVAPNLNSESLAFLVYSSGTTGKPKGITMPQRGPVLSYNWRFEAYPYDPSNDEREACNVFFVWELLRPLLRGQTLYIIPDDVIYDPTKLLQFLEQHRITRMLFTPSLLETVLEFSKESILSGFQTMRQVWLCGEVTTTQLMKKALDLIGHVQFINLYSVSECHDVAAINLTKFYKNKPEKMQSKFAPVGKLLPDVKVAILNDEFKLQPVGVSGEIYVYGPTLAHGYLKRPDLNKNKFMPLTTDLTVDCQPNQKIYRTGDWGYLLSDGSLEIYGRCDAMVKIRGYSVEVSAIENTILGLGYVQSCSVLTHGEEGDDKVLVAYLVPSQPNITIKLIRGDLKRRLPFYMIPSYFVFLKELPIVPGSGKLNKKALPALDKSQHQCQPEYLPETETEKALAAIWSRVLQLMSIDVQESFFDLGGHSLLAAKLLNIVNDQFNCKLSVKDLYNSPTLIGMAKIIDRKSPDKEPQLDLQQEVEVHNQCDIDLDMQLRAFWRFASFNKTRWSKACVLLTGSTGFLGAFILAELLKKTESQIFCLIRENTGQNNNKDVMEIQSRLRKTLHQYYLLEEDTDSNDNKQSDESLNVMINRRVIFVKGDVSLINFGLSEDDYRYLSTEIDLIIHAAAYVNLIYPYSALYCSNVLGTCNIIKFAGTSKIKPLHYVSTDAVFPDSMVGKEDSDLSGIWLQLKDGYSQSKWVAEQIIYKASQRGHPVVIYRLGNQAADTINAAFNLEDFNFMMIRSFVQLGCCPDIEWFIEMTPVNFSAQVIVEVARNLSIHVGKIYHIINTKPLNIKTLHSWLTIHGFKSELISYTDYLEKLKSANTGFLPKLYSMLSEVAKTSDYFKQLPKHDSKLTQQLLNKQSGLQFPEINNSLLTLYFTKFIENKIIPKPRSLGPSFSLCEESTLAGKVVIVTGASSGIGEETSVQLAKHGCLVAMLARREDKLKSIQEIINSLGGRAIYIKTDVTNYSDVLNALDTAETVLGPIDVLINCAGLMYYQLAYKLDMGKAQAMIDVNVKGVLNCCSVILPGMVKRGKGHIVNVTSDAGVVGFPGLAVYSGSKFFVEGYSQALRQELMALNNEEVIRVSCVRPGDVRTPLQDSSTSVDPEAVKQYFSGNSSQPNKILEPIDVAKTIVFIISAPSYAVINSVLVEPSAASI